MVKKIQLIPHWREAWRYWSLRLTTLGTLLITYLTASPEAVLQAWAVLPEDIKAFLPPNYSKFVAIGILALGAVARIIKQPKAEEKIAVKEAVTEAKKAEEQNTASTNSTLTTILAIGALLLLAAVSNKVEAAERTLTCTQPTHNNDGTPLTDFGGMRYLWGDSPTTLYHTTYVDKPSPPHAYKITGLTNGKWYFACIAYKTNGMESAISTVVNVDIVSTTLPTTPPLPPTAVVLTNEVFQVIMTVNQFQFLPVGTVPANTPCIPTQKINDYYAVNASVVTWYGRVRPKVVVAKCS